VLFLVPIDCLSGVDWEPDLLTWLFPEDLSADLVFCAGCILAYIASPSLL